MSSAAKLRKYGRGTATVAAAALVMTSFGPAAFASFDDAPQTGAVETGLNYGSIGIVDSDSPVGQAHVGHQQHIAGPDGHPAAPVAAGDALSENQSNHGATLVQAGQKNQRIADVRLVIPNRFKSGDIIDVRLLDRSATEHADGTSNQGPDNLVGFSADPKVSVGEAAAAGTRVNENTEDASASNTESPLANPWVAAPGATGQAALKPGVKPSFTVSRTQSNGVQGYDNIRLRIDSNASTGDPNGVWVVSLSDLSVDLGPQVTPGELRVVPFASNKRDNGETYYASEWFQGNVKGDAQKLDGSNFHAPNPQLREIGTYTVPAYVAPVTVSSENTSIVADGMPQSIGAIKLTETKPYSLGTGTYTLRIANAQVSNPTSDAVKVTMTGGDTGESVAKGTITNNPGTNSATLTFSYTANTTSPSVPATISVEGLLLETTTPAQLEFGFTGGTLSQTWFAIAGTSGAVGTAIPGDDALLEGLTAGDPPEAGATVPSSLAITQQALSGVTVAVNQVAGTATKLPAGAYTVADGGTAAGLEVSGPGGLVLGADTVGNGVVSGTPLALGATNWTDSTPASGFANTDTITLTNVQPGMTFVVDANGAVASTTDTTPISVAPQQNVPNSTYTVSAGTNTGFKLTGQNGIVFDDVTDGVLYTVDEVAPANTTDPNNLIDDGATFTVSNLSVGDVFTLSGSPAITLDEAVNQRDIVAPDDELLQSGIAQAPSNRIGGNNRYETAAKIAERWALGNKSLDHGKLKNVILASGENFPDALSAAYLSQRMGAPVLLTMRGSIPGDTMEALRDRQVEKVFIVGGEAAVSNQVADKLLSTKSYYYDNVADTVKEGAQNLSVVRLGGNSRYTTNQLVNYYAAAWGGENTVGKTVYKFGEAGKFTAIVARGDNFPDALAAGVLTRGIATGASSDAAISSRALPLVLTEPGELSAPARDQVERLDIQHALIIGSENAVSDGVKKSLEDMGLTDTRLGGQDRYFTAAAVDEFAMRDSAGSATNAYPGLGFLTYAAGVPDPTNQMTSYIATGLKFPDALTASPWIGRNTDALNLVWPGDLTDGTRDFLSKRASDISNVIALGLGDVVSTKVLSDANKLVSVK